MSKQQGIVRFFREDKGWGFLQSQSGEDVFVHFTGIVGEGFKTLTAGQSVEFDVESAVRGPKAINVSVLPS